LESGLLQEIITNTWVSTSSASIASPCRGTAVPVMADPCVPGRPSKERVKAGGGTAKKEAIEES
jgi:hypothetical protein